MSTNLLSGLAITEDANTVAQGDGTYLCKSRTDTGTGYTDVMGVNLKTDVFTANQTVHLAVSLRGKSGTVEKNQLWMYVRYVDSAGHLNYTGRVLSSEMTVTASTGWTRFELSAIIPSGMYIDRFAISDYGRNTEFYATSPCLSYGGPVTLSIASTTVAWSASIVATVRYWQLAAPTAATPAVPASASALGSWSETEPDVDTSKVLWHCERTVYSDGTESWSKASKSTSYEAAKKNASDIAQLPTKTDVSTSIRKESESINATIKSATTVDGKTVAEQINSINQTIDGTTQTFERHQSELDDLKGTLDDLTASISTYMDESGRPVIEMGASSSNLKTRLTNDALEFISDGRFVAGASGDRFRAPMVDADDIRIGGYAVTESTDGSVSIDWNGV